MAPIAPVMGANGVATFKYWVAAVGDSISEGNPTGSITLTGGNAGWVGVDTAFLGLSSPSLTYRANNTGANAWFDEFDSRRQTFIGN